ncbi:MarR family transcriptional regulator [Halopiger xanaduensis]|uniref:Regulatory protein MarR n=1 Tax=Halopiger xanaduensis (strain DSM 18323 / JCM 14033 / SH-6) TaxID=797210 RepID=F8DD62_HALXS|nr:helix-turn-helix domain-containing protein [Halopiger xanaduensis]AEH38949.1 regulatory protein MarR [Halopiger xanaduensis SH-6]
MSAIAEEVSGATTELVEKVLEEYGDPGQSAADDRDEPIDVEESSDESGVSDDESDEPTVGGTLSESNDDPSDDSVSLEFDSSRATADRGSSSDDSAAPSSGAASPLANDDEQAAVDDAESDGETATETDSETDPDDSDGSDGSDVPDPASFTEAQLETLRAVHERPDATQAELASMFGITSASVSQRVNSIDGFEWDDRRAFTAALFDDGESDADESGAESGDRGATVADSRPRVTDSGSTEASSESEVVESDAESALECEAVRPEPSENDRACTDAIADRLAAVTARVDRLEQQIADRTQSAAEPVSQPTDETVSESVSQPTDETVSALADPELAHKVVHACMKSDRISEDEELRIIRSMMGAESER